MVLPLWKKEIRFNTSNTPRTMIVIVFIKIFIKVIEVVEFIVFIKGTDQTDLAEEIARDLVAGTAKNVLLPDGDQTVSVSVGIAVYRGAEKNYSEIFKKADLALYQAKADREKRCRIYEA